MPCVVAAAVLAIYLAARIVRGHWGPRVLPFAALLVMLAGPAELGGNKLESIHGFDVFRKGAVGVRRAEHRLSSLKCAAEGEDVFHGAPEFCVGLEAGVSAE